MPHESRDALRTHPGPRKGLSPPSSHTQLNLYCCLLAGHRHRCNGGYMPDSLPAQANLRQLQIQAKELARELKLRSAHALDRFAKATGRQVSGPFKLSDAHWTIAREYGFENWAELKKEIAQRRSQVELPLQSFQHAVRSGDVHGLRRLLARHPELKKQLNEPLFDFASPAIRVAVDRKDLAMIDALLAAGADINQRSKWQPGGFGVLDTADDELARELIARGANVDVHAAAHLGKVDRLQELLDQDPALVNSRGGDGGTPLHFARDLAITDLLLSREADFRIRDLDHGSTAAMWQVRKRDVLYRLIEAGSPIDIYMACVHGDRELADRALREDPDCLSAYVSHSRGQGKFAPDTGGNIYNWQIGHAARPIPVAARFNHTLLVHYLLDRAKPIDRLIALCFVGDMAAAKKLSSEQPSILNALDESAARALPDAIQFGDQAAAEAMIALGYPLTGRGANGGTALHLAAWTGNGKLVAALIEKGAPLDDRRNDFTSTPLEWACHGSLHYHRNKRTDYVSVVEALRSAGAQIDHIINTTRNNSPNWAAPEVIKALGA